MLKRVFRTNKGSAIVDASICLPVFIIILGMMISKTLSCGYEAKLYYELSRNTAYSCLFNYDLDNTTEYLCSSGQNAKYNLSVSLYYRPFIGENPNYVASNIVYVFPKSGEKYHLPGCSTMDRNKNYIEITIEEAEEQGYTPCKLCMEGGEDFFKK